MGIFVYAFEALICSPAAHLVGGTLICGVALVFVVMMCVPAPSAAQKTFGCHGYE